MPDKMIHIDKVSWLDDSNQTSHITNFQNKRIILKKNLSKVLNNDDLDFTFYYPQFIYSPIYGNYVFYFVDQNSNKWRGVIIDLDRSTNPFNISYSGVRYLGFNSNTLYLRTFSPSLQYQPEHLHIEESDSHQIYMYQPGWETYYYIEVSRTQDAVDDGTGESIMRHNNSFLTSSGHNKYFIRADYDPVNNKYISCHDFIYDSGQGHYVRGTFSVDGENWMEGKRYTFDPRWFESFYSDKHGFGFANTDFPCGDVVYDKKNNVGVVVNRNSVKIFEYNTTEILLKYDHYGTTSTDFFPSTNIHRMFVEHDETTGRNIAIYLNRNDSKIYCKSFDITMNEDLSFNSITQGNNTLLYDGDGSAVICYDIEYNPTTQKYYVLCSTSSKLIVKQFKIDPNNHNQFIIDEYFKIDDISGSDECVIQYNKDLNEFVIFNTTYDGSLANFYIYSEEDVVNSLENSVDGHANQVSLAIWAGGINSGGSKLNEIKCTNSAASNLQSWGTLATSSSHLSSASDSRACLFAGGYNSSSSKLSGIYLVSFSDYALNTSWGSLNTARSEHTSGSNSISAMWISGSENVVSNTGTIEKTQFSSNSASVYWGYLLDTLITRSASASNGSMLLIAGGRTSAPSGANTISGVGTGSYIDSKLIWKKDFFSNSNLTRFGYLSAMPSLTYTTDYGEPVIYSGGSGWSFTPGSTSSQINDNNKLRGRFYAVGGAIDDTALFFGGGCSGTSNNGSVEYSFSTSEKIGFLDEARSASLWNYRDSSYVYGSAGCANDTSLVVACGQAMSSFKTNSFRISFSSFDENSFSDSTSFFPSSRSMFTGETGG